MQQLHERLSARAEHFENTGPEDDDLQKSTDRAAFAGLLHRAAEIVKVHETGEREADLFDPLTGMWKPTVVHGCAPARFERSASGKVTMLPEDVQRLQELEAKQRGFSEILAQTNDILDGCSEFLKRPPLIDDRFKAAWKYLWEHLLNEMACGEPEGREVLDIVGPVMDKLTAPQPVVGVDQAAPEKRDETVVAIYDGSGGLREQWREGDKCTVDGEGGQVFTVTDLAEHSAMMLDAGGYAHGREGYQKMHKVPGARSGLVTDPTDAADFVPVVEPSPGLTRENDEHLADVLQDAADAIRELLQPGEGDDPDDIDEITLDPEDARTHAGLLQRAGEALRARPVPLPPDLVTRASAAAHALEQYEAVVTRKPSELAAEAFTDETVVETAVKVLREIVAAVDKQPEQVDARFVGSEDT